MEDIFEISIWHRGLESRLICSGEIDITTAPKLQDAVELVLETRPSILYIDWVAVSFVAIAGVEVLLRTKSLCERNGVVLRIAMSRSSRRVLDMLGCGDISGHEDPSASRDVADELRNMMSLN